MVLKFGAKFEDVNSLIKPLEIEEVDDESKKL